MAGPARLVLILLAIEFLDELVFGAREAAWPLISQELGLNYAQIGLLLGLPGIFASLIEPFLGILGDVWKRRVLVLGGGCAFVAALVLLGLSPDFLVLLLAFLLLYPASGAFVSLSQATLMDSAPDRREQNMARWTFAGSLGVMAGTLAMGGAAGLGWGWRPVFLTFALIALVILVLVWPVSHAGRLPDLSPAPVVTFRDGLRGAAADLRRFEVVRWLVLLEFSDLMLDILLGFLALYFVNVAGVSPATAGLAVAVWTGVGLLGDFLLIPLLERVDGLRYLRLSALLELLLFPAFLLASPIWLKLVLIGLLGFFNAGWYSILQAQLYHALPGRSGTALALKNVSGLAASLLPVGLGFAAERFGLANAMWLLLLGPLVLLWGLPGLSFRTAGKLDT